MNNKYLVLFCASPYSNAKFEHYEEVSGPDEVSAKAIAQANFNRKAKHAPAFRKSLELTGLSAHSVCIKEVVLFN